MLHVKFNWYSKTVIVSRVCQPRHTNLMLLTYLKTKKLTSNKKTL